MKVRQTATFSRWLKKLKDHEARARIIVRIKRFEQGNLGDAKSVGGGVSEARLTYGPGYRLYFTERGGELIILLCGGTKGSQEDDIRTAKRLKDGF